MSFKKRKISILGSTGSIGTNTLNIIRDHRDRFDVASLSCGSSVPLLLQQINEFKPEAVSVATEALARDLKGQLPLDTKVKVFYGIEGHQRTVEETQPDVLLSSMNGTFGLKATLQAVKQSVPVVGIANKEILVMAGPFILDALKSSSSELVPVDSEHSAIFQALMGNKMEAVKNVILTASGGPFRTRDIKTFDAITRQEALKHPNWVMGSKITVDSATMMNKGLEYIEAIRLFNIPTSKLKVIVHPESIVHSMVEYHDGSFMAQLGISDMRVPISLALNYPDRLPLNLGKELDLVKLGALHFEEPDLEKFPCLKMAMDAEEMGPQGSVILNAANEIAVEKFLSDKIRFVDIAKLIEAAICHFGQSQIQALEEVIDLDKQVKLWVTEFKLSNPIRRDETNRETIPA
jgi:1-deoxy-D-xylulose-5-phosphate reductoisomerase